MVDEKKTHTQGEVDSLVAIARVETLQHVLNSEFNEHKKEDSEHLDRLYDADKRILAEVTTVPEKLIKCSETLKTDILNISRREFTTITNFEIFRTEVKASVRVGVAIGSVASSIIVTIVIAAWSLIKTGGLL